ncbi:MAG: phosphodiester glycosidase family protein [Anaerolineae bacterium]
MKNKHPFALFYTAILIMATVWSLLDTFVIADKLAVVDETLANTSIYTNLANTAAANVAAENALNETANAADEAALASTPAVTPTSTPAVAADKPTQTSGSLAAAADAVAAASDPASIVDAVAAAGSVDNTLIQNSTGTSMTPVVTDTSYQDANIQITIEKIRQYNTDIYIADVVVSDVAYLKTALAQNTYGKNIKQTTSAMAAEHQAILAINGDYYGFRNAGFVLRNGVLYRTTARTGSSEALVVNADGNFEIITESSTDAQTLYDQGALQVFTFGPGLINAGKISVTSSSEVSQSMSSNPRTALGMIAPLHYVFVVSDGRTAQSTGLSLLQLAEVMQAYGCTEAYNLDGGGSSTMVFNGEVVNNPTDGRSFGERKVSDIIYIGAQL